MRENETYIIDLCDDVLNERGRRQYRFEFLRGDTGWKLPVDAYYPKVNLVIEFHERQHGESVPFFDRRPTASGVSRGEQRKIYDERRRETLPKHGITLIELCIDEFEHTKRGLLKKPEMDKEIVLGRLGSYVANKPKVK